MGSKALEVLYRREVERGDQPTLNIVVPEALRAQLIVAAHDGKIHARSSALGGLAVEVELPLAR